MSEMLVSFKEKWENKSVKTIRKLSQHMDSQRLGQYARDYTQQGKTMVKNLLSKANEAIQRRKQ